MRTTSRTLWSAALLVATAACSSDTTAPATSGAPSLAKGDATAGNPQFNKAGTDLTRVGDNLVVNFKETGLAAGSVQTISLTATGTATFVCINGGGKNPSAANKRTVTEPLATTANFPVADKNGNLTGTLTLMPPGPGDFSCPSGQTLSGPTDVSFSNVVLTDETSGATRSFAGTF
jgi:hypothetical protein